MLGYNFKFVEDVEIAGYNVSAFFFRACLALTLYTSAFVCEAMRSGVNAVPLGQAEAGRAIGLTFAQSMTLVILPQAARAVIPPMTSVMIALAKNTSVAAAFGLAEATATMRALHQQQRRRADRDLPRVRDRLHHRRRGHLAVVLPRRAKGEGGPMSASVLFDAPGPRTVARHRIYTVISIAALVAMVAFAVWTLYDAGQLEYALWEPFFTPEYVEYILVDGLLETLKMAFFSIIFAVVFGLVFGVAKLSDRGWVRWPAWLVVEFFRAVPVLLLMVFAFFLLAIGNGPLSSFWCVVIALTLYNGSVLAEVFRAGINAVPRGQAEAAYAIGMRKSQVMTTVLLPQAVKIMLPAIISQMVVALKDTSLGYYILAPGLTAVAKPIYLEFSNQVPTAIVITGIYVAVNLVLTWVATLVQKRLVGEKKVLDVPMVGAPTGPGAPVV